MITKEEYLDLKVVELAKKDSQRLVYNREIEEQLIEEARDGYPFEITGFLLGKKADFEVVSELFPVKNIASHKERRFEIHGLDYLKVENYALQNDLEVIGIYHSHPDYPALPSRHDLKYAQDVFAYVIVSVDGGGTSLINSWKKENGKFVNQEIIIDKR
ncbi:M67 family metallopeptidase [Crocinitomix catalasitica]|nr:M67 family metallopeptidase [Crocinitomix catalasitica]